MNAMSALYHIAQNDSPTLGMTQTQQGSDTNIIQWSDNFKNFISWCLKKQPNLRQNAQELLAHPFIMNFSDRKALVDLIRKTKEIVRDLDNLQFRKMKKIIMIDGSSSSSGGITNGNTSENNTSNTTSTSRDRGGSESGCSSLLNLKNDGSETSQTSHGFDAISQFEYYENDDGYENEEDPSSSTNENFKYLKPFTDTNEINVDPSLLGIKNMITQINKMDLKETNNANNSPYNKNQENSSTSTSQNKEVSKNTSSINSLKSSTSSTKTFGDSLKSNTSILSNNSVSPPVLKSSLRTNVKDLFNYNDSLRRNSDENRKSETITKSEENGAKNFASHGFATIKTTQAIVCEEQLQREHQEIIEFQNLKRQHMKLLKALELKCKIELDELKIKLQKEYNQDIQQFSKELDAISLKHVRELEELVCLN
jgi:hypothetical protein